MSQKRENKSLLDQLKEIIEMDEGEEKDNKLVFFNSLYGKMPFWMRKELAKIDPHKTYPDDWFDAEKPKDFQSLSELENAHRLLNSVKEIVAEDKMEFTDVEEETEEERNDLSFIPRRGKGI
jgi:hypothetical protein